MVEVPVENAQRLNQLLEDNTALKQHIKQLEKQVNQPPTVIEKVVEVEKPVPVEVEKIASGDLREAARLISVSDFNTGKLSAEDIYNTLLKSSEDDIKRRLGFWAVPLPKIQNENDVDKKYTGKK